LPTFRSPVQTRSIAIAYRKAKMEEVVDFCGTIEQLKIFLSALAVEQRFLYIDAFYQIYSDSGIIIKAKVVTTGP
jgi:hypothetical protein